jgi:hypothetical protein
MNYGRMIMTDESEAIQYEAVLVDFEVMSQCLAGGAEGNA